MVRALAEGTHSHDVLVGRLQLLDGAEAKAYYGLASNYGALGKLVEVLLDEGTISGERLGAVLQVPQP